MSLPNHKVYSYNSVDAEKKYDMKTKELADKKYRAKLNNNWIRFEQIIREQVKHEENNPRIKPVI